MGRELIEKIMGELRWLPASIKWWATGGMPRWQMEAKIDHDDRPIIILIQGFFEGNFISRKGHDWLEEMGFYVMTPGIYKIGVFNIGDINKYNQRVIAWFEKHVLPKLRKDPGRKVVICGYSKGGFTGLELLMKFSSLIDHVFLISCPINGCALADFFGPILPIMAAKQMQRNAPFLQELKKRLAERPGILRRVSSIASTKDAVVAHLDAKLPGASRNIKIGMPHLEMYLSFDLYSRIGTLAHFV